MWVCDGFRACGFAGFRAYGFRGFRAYGFGGLGRVGLGGEPVLEVPQSRFKRVLKGPCVIQLAGFLYNYSIPTRGYQQVRPQYCRFLALSL